MEYFDFCPKMSAMLPHIFYWFCTNTTSGSCNLRGVGGGEVTPPQLRSSAVFYIPLILKMIVTSGFLTALECTKFDFGRCPGPTGGANSTPPDPLAGLRGPTSKLRGGKGTGRRGGEEVEEGQGREVKTPPPSIPAYAPGVEEPPCWSNALKPHFREGLP